MNKILYIIICFTFLHFTSVFAQVGLKTDAECIEGYEARIYRKKGFNRLLPYRFFTPKANKDGRLYPLVIFMHGAGKGQGTDNISQLLNGSRTFVDKKVQENHPCYVLAPQCPPDVWWVNVKNPPGISPEIDAEIRKETSKKGFRLKARSLMNDPDLYFPLDINNITEPMQMVSELIDDIISEYPIDPDRIYITGGSMGGLGTWCLAFLKPERPAAIAPLCSPSDPEHAWMLKHIPIWIFHGDQDDYFPVKTSRDMYKALKESGNDKVIYTELPGVAHGGLSSKAYRWDENNDGEPDLVTWLFSQVRNKK